MGEFGIMAAFLVIMGACIGVVGTVGVLYLLAFRWKKRMERQMAEDPREPNPAKRKNRTMWS